LEQALATFVNVILPLNLNKLYTYRVPRETENFVETGKRVIVQFGAKRVYSAIIYDVHNTPPKGYEAKYILGVLDEKPIVSALDLKFWLWISNYYMSSIGDVMNAALPAALKLESKTKVQINPDYESGSSELDDREFLIIEALELAKELTIEDVAEVVQLKNPFPVLKSLLQKGAIIMQEEFNEKYKERFLSCIKLAEKYTQESELQKLFEQLEKKQKQLDTLMVYLQLVNEKKHVEKNKILLNISASAGSLSTLIKNNIFEEYKVKTDRINLEETPNQTFDLNEIQSQKLGEIKAAFNKNKVVLLHGVTSSGKTHIYVKLIEDAIAEGKQVLYLLPEIALTSQIVQRVRKYFSGKCISYHSKYNDNERVEIWQKVSNAHYNIVIGARSALFLPFANLGLIIIDEEHENSYKQNDPAPRYHARDAAVYLASLWKSNCILGSATPSFESYYNCTQGKFDLVKLDTRFGNIALPEICTADIKEENRVKTMRGNFTSVLFNEVNKALQNHEQIILFQNRRGFAPLLQCNVCSWTPKCQNCDISLTYHKFIDSLKCHYCGFSKKIPKCCEACGSHLLTFKGVGTEKIEDEIKILFPDARVSRLDLDSTKSKHGHEQIISDFENYKSDILVGTQMLSKGLDFEKVSLVGIINADQILHFPDFRANEKAFQLLSQVSGRSGRKHKKGKVIIQTSLTKHDIILATIEGNYELVFEKEMEERKSFAYPPFYRIIRLTLKNRDYKTVEQAAFKLRSELNLLLKDCVLGPESPFVSRIRNLYIKEMLIKIDKSNNTLAYIKQFITQSIAKIHEDKLYRNVIIYADVDPY